MKCLISHKTSRYLLPQFEKYFKIVLVDLSNVNDHYNPDDYFVFIDNREDQHTIGTWRDRGYKVVVEKFWEQLVDDPRGTYIEDGCLHLYTKNWLWFDLALINKYSNYNYVRLSQSPTQFFLMLMNLRKLARDRLFSATEPYHADSLYSYVERGILIQGDVPAHGSGGCVGTSDQRFYNPSWYANTNFSMVAETHVTSKRFVSEKIFKPLAFCHPFLVYGTPGTLRFLHELGFETFDHVIDESYDDIINEYQRLASITTVLTQLHREFKQGALLFADSISQQKLQHNYNKFYDIAYLWEMEIINPIKEFINS